MISSTCSQENPFVSHRETTWKWNVMRNLFCEVIRKTCTHPSYHVLWPSRELSMAAQKSATNDLREVHQTKKTCEMRETHKKKGCVQDNTKIDYTCFAIQLFSRAIKFYPLSHKTSTVRWFEMREREICLRKQYKQHKITHTHVSHLTDDS